MSTFTHIPQIVDALVALFNSSMPELAAVGGIYDGPPTTYESNDYAMVAYNPGTVARPQVPAIRASQGLSDYIPGGTVEQVEIFCQISTYSGDLNMSVSRSQAMTYFNEMSTGLAADRSLGGLVPLPGKAQVNAVQWYLEQGNADSGPAGVSVTVTFTITATIEFM